MELLPAHRESLPQKLSAASLTNSAAPHRMYSMGSRSVTDRVAVPTPEFQLLN